MFNISADVGWCLDENGNDQNIGTKTSPTPNSFTSVECLAKCLNMTNVTGCEYHNDGGCAYHTKYISGGNGNNDYLCWTLNNGKVNLNLIVQVTIYRCC